MGELWQCRRSAFAGLGIVDEVVGLCAMNLYLPGSGNEGSLVTQHDVLEQFRSVSAELAGEGE